jgi:putative transposase
MSSTNGRLYNLDHYTYICQYHVVWVAKYRGKVLTDTYIKQELKRIFKSIARWKGFTVIQWHVGDEHVHLYIIIPPKYSIAYAIQILKGKSSAWIKKKTKKLPQGPLWARGYFVSTIGINEFQIKKYIENQHQHREELPKLPLWKLGIGGR